MAIPKSIISRKTKPEIIAEYEKLLTELDDMKSLSKEVHDADNKSLMVKSENLTKGANNKISKSVTDLKKSVESSLNALIEDILTETENLQELQQAVELMKKNLKLHHNVKVAADTLENLISENELKKHQFELEAKQRQMELEEKMSLQEREWKRKQEEKEYEAAKKLKRQEEEFDDKISAQKKLLEQRAGEFEEKAEELEELREQTAKAPVVLEKALQDKEKEVAQKLKDYHQAEIKQAKQEWASEKQVLELKITNLQDTLKKQLTEINNLKQEAERANKRTQELAVKVIQGAQFDTRAVKED